MLLARARSRGRAGFSVVELLITLTILLVATRMTVQTLVSVNRLSPANRETSAALAAVKNVIEEMRNVEFSEIFARYNDDPSDDPALGSSPGADFDADLLEAQAADADGLVGRIEFPTLSGELREDFDDRDLGMPRDLNGDGIEDVSDHAGDYAILPVRIRIEWSGRAGDRAYEAYTTFTDQ